MKGISIYPLFTDGSLNEVSYKELNVYNDKQDFSAPGFPDYDSLKNL